MRIVNVKKDEIIKEERTDDFNRRPLNSKKEILEDRLELFDYVSVRGMVEYTFKIEKLVYASSFPDGIVDIVVKGSVPRGSLGDSVRVNFRDIGEIRRQGNQDGFYSIYFKSQKTLVVDLYW